MTAENTGHPEDQQDISMKDMLVYSGIVEQEQSIKKIKDDAEISKKPKPIDDDSAIVLYDKNLSEQATDHLGSQDSSTEASDTSESDDKKQENKPKESNQVEVSEKTDVEISIKENKQESAEVKKNTDKWAHASKQDINKVAEKDDEDQPVYENMSQAEYEKLFHAATVSAGNEMDKSFDQLQQEDLAKKKSEIAQNKKQEAEEEATKKDVLDKQDEGTGKINDQEFDAQRLGNVPMETAISYTDQAADKGQEFGEQATKNMTKKADPKKKLPKEQQKEKSQDKPKSFYEELLNEAQKENPNAVAELSKPLDLSKKDQSNEAQKKQKEEDIPLEEQLFERNNPDLAQELVMQNESSQKFKEAKEAKEKQENSLGGILAEAGISDENTKL